MCEKYNQVGCQYSVTKNKHNELFLKFINAKDPFVKVCCPYKVKSFQRTGEQSCLNIDFKCKYIVKIFINSTTKLDVSTVTKKHNQLFFKVTNSKDPFVKRVLSKTINAKYKAKSFHRTGKKISKTH